MTPRGAPPHDAQVRLVPVTVQAVDAELAGSRARLAEALGVEIGEWPPRAANGIAMPSSSFIGE